MELLSLTKGQFKKLKKLELDSRITTIESDIYKIPKKAKDNREVLKKYKKNDSYYFGNKLLTINSLIHAKEQLESASIILPNKLAVVDKKIIGYTMDFVDGPNLSLLLHSDEITTKEKINYLKQVEKIIQSCHHFELEEPFLLADIHESNFVLDSKSNKLYGVDIDGCKISNNKVYSIKYGSFNEKFFDFPFKYPLDDEDEPIPSLNTEWYCFITMVLNTIGNGPVYKLMLDDYYDYLQFLKDSNLDRELIDMFYNLYNKCDNHAPRELIDAIPANLNPFDISKYLEKNKNKKYYKSIIR